MTITAKFPGTCPACGGEITPGTKIEWSKGEKARHTDCPINGGRKGAATTPRATYRRSTGRRYGSGAGSAAPVAGYSSYCTDRPGCGCFDCAS